MTLARRPVSVLPPGQSPLLCYRCPTLHPVLLKFFKAATAVGVLTFLQVRFAAHLSRYRIVFALARHAKRISRQKALSVFVVGFAVLLLRIALLPISGVPQPGYPDEFSYLLAADTFAHGRITNPPHPMWVHFEGLHIIQQPTYMSMYPPAEGLVLAFGEWLCCPWIGQLLITALMCAALCWALQGWLPPGWALLGAVLASAQVGLLSYWMNGYWSASVPALGGALVIGALPRISTYLRWRDALLMAIGLAVLANSRPYEGLVLALPATIVLLRRLQQRHLPISIIAKRFVLPILLVLLPATLATGYYNHRVTGSAFRMPQQVNRSAYSMAPYFIWQRPLPEPAYRHPKLRDFYYRELSQFEENMTPISFLRTAARKLASLWQFFLGAPLSLGLIGLPLLFHDKKMRMPVALLAICLIGLLLETWELPHYLAPATALIYLIVVQSMRHIFTFQWKRKPVGAAWIRSVSAVTAGLVAVAVLQSFNHPAEWQHAGDLRRAQIVSTLNAAPGQHLVIVEDRPPFGHGEWVYNRADIDSSKTVWARDMGPEKNKELLEYFHGRTVWAVNLADSLPRLRGYSEP